jgi:putative glutathione S-transferase
VEFGYPHILKLLRRIYQYEGGIVQRTINVTHFMKSYYMSKVKINPTQIVPLGLGPDLNVPVDD